MSGTILAAAGRFAPNWGLVLGSGLGGMVEAFDLVEEFPMAEVEEMLAPKVEGHQGRLALARSGNARVLILQGRVHLYEGCDEREVTAGVRFLHGCGVERVIFTNAAGSVSRELSPGVWMLIRDHLNLTGTSPLRGTARFLDMSDAYSSRLREKMRAAAAAEGLALAEGVYAGLPGPQYETPAEVAMLRSWGADAVGMSTVLEVIEARARGMEVAGCSLITNHGAGLGEDRLNHADVMQSGAAGGGRMGRVIARMLREAS